jgi:SAM-dependent methyltransferase
MGNSVEKENPEAEQWYEESFSQSGFSAQRKYPNEEFCRFMGRNFFPFETAKRQETQILEVGCGSGSNLWMIAAEGFQAYGLDFSASAIKLTGKMLDSYNVSANLSVQDMMNMDFVSGKFDSVVDVFSSCCLDSRGGENFLNEVSRVLKVGGLFFSYFPSKKSEAFTNHAPASLLDECTLDGIRRTSSPYYGNFYPFRFLSLEDYEGILNSAGLGVRYRESVGRTYRNGEEYFEWVCIEAVKQ